MSPIRRALAAAAIVIGSALATAAQAVSQTTAYNLTLTIDRIDQFSPCNSSPNGHISFGCLSVGNTFTGTFSVDSSILATDGITTSASIYDFFLPFGAALYASGPENITLAGYRNGSGFASAPGFVIEGGQVVDWVGGVFGGADFPFIDMYGEGGPGGIPRNRFIASDGVTSARGSLSIAAAVPEPETYAMMALGLVAVGWVARRRKAVAAPAPQAA